MPPVESHRDIIRAGVSAFASVGGAFQRDMTGYTGADVALPLGGCAFYDFSNITSLPFRLATQDNQVWEIDLNFDHAAGAGNSANLLMNNAAFGSAVCHNHRSDINEAGTSGAVPSNTTSFQLIPIVRPYFIHATVRTRTTGKSVDTRYKVAGTSGAYITGGIVSTCTDTTTPCTSLGTVQFGAALSGRATVRMISGNSASNNTPNIARHLIWRVLEKTQDWPNNGTLALGGDLVIPFDGNILDIEADVDTAGVGGTPIIDVNYNGTSIMTTDKLKWDSGEKSTRNYSGNAPGLTTVAVTKGGIITLDVDANTTTRAKGLSLYLAIEQQ